MAERSPRTTYAEGWSLYPLSMIGHHAQGALAGVAVVHGTAQTLTAAALWTALYLAYQGLSVLRKKDSPGLDIVDYMAGLLGGGIGTAAGTALSLA